MTKTIQKESEVEKSKQLSTGNGGALVAAEAFIDESDFESGFEGADLESFAIPFIQILQKMSPLVDSDDPKHIEGAKAGMLFDTVSQRLFDGKKGIAFVPCSFKRSMVEWGARDAGGGFKGEHTPEDIKAMVDSKELIDIEGRVYRPDENGKVDVKKANYIADTRTHFIMVLIEDEKGEFTGETIRAILPLSSTQRKASKNLLTLLNTKKVNTPNGKRTPPSFANIVRMTTIGQSNDKGTWSGAKFELEGMVTDGGMYQEAKSFYQAFSTGAVKADFARADNVTAESTAAGVSDTAETAENF